MTTHFEERSGIVPCSTPWGRWWQTIDEVFIEVDVPEGTKAKNVTCNIKNSYLNVRHLDSVIIQGELPFKIHAEESLWTLEDKKLVRIVLAKADRSALRCWKSLLTNQYEADPFTYQEMEKKITLHRFQLENPGMDFSNAEVSGNYHGGGPNFT